MTIYNILLNFSLNRKKLHVRTLKEREKARNRKTAHCDIADPNSRLNPKQCMKGRSVDDCDCEVLDKTIKTRCTGNLQVHDSPIDLLRAFTLCGVACRPSSLWPGQNVGNGCTAEDTRIREAYSCVYSGSCSSGVKTRRLQTGTCERDPCEQRSPACRRRHHQLFPLPGTSQNPTLVPLRRVASPFRYRALCSDKTRSTCLSIPSKQEQRNKHRGRLWVTCLRYRGRGGMMHSKSGRWNVIINNKLYQFCHACIHRRHGSATIL